MIPVLEAADLPLDHRESFALCPSKTCKKVLQSPIHIANFDKYLDGRDELCVDGEAVLDLEDAVAEIPLEGLEDKLDAGVVRLDVLQAQLFKG